RRESAGPRGPGSDAARLDRYAYRRAHEKVASARARVVRSPVSIASFAARLRRCPMASKPKPPVALSRVASRDPRRSGNDSLRLARASLVIRFPAPPPRHLGKDEVPLLWGAWQARDKERRPAPRTQRSSVHAVLTD